MSFVQEFWTALNHGALALDPGGWRYVLIVIFAFLEGPVITLAAATLWYQQVRSKVSLPEPFLSRRREEVWG